MIPLCYLIALQVSILPLSDIAFGGAQVEQFMRDRPDTRPIIRGNPALREFLIGSFAGVSTGCRVRWDASEPRPGGGMHYISRDVNYPSKVQIATKSKLSAVDQCAVLVFELHNTRQRNRILATANMARSESIGRESFARSRLLHEFESMRRTRDFFLAHPIANGHAERNYQYNFIASTPDDFAQMLERQTGPNKPTLNFLEYYRAEYDQIVIRKNQ